MILKNIHHGQLKGVTLFEIGRFEDMRGFFTELYHSEELKKAGFTETFVQDNLSLSQKGVLRGMHYQLEPHGMGKLVCCISGEIYDVIVDLRKGSPTFGKWEGFNLSGNELSLLWVPVGFAHGFLSQSDNTIVLYKCTSFYNKDAERSLSYRCPKVGIKWHKEPLVISEKDRNAPNLDQAEYNFVFKEC